MKADALTETYKEPAELYCSPANHKYAENDKTCFKHSELKLLAKEFNNRNEDKPKIKGKTKKELATQLLVAYKGICDKHQFCWIKQTLTNNEQITKLEKAFRPKKPAEWDRDQNTWLNTYDILYVLKQYEELYKDFLCLGVYPIDFNDKNSSGRCIGDMLCDFDIYKNILDIKKKQFCIVFNTDPSYKSGAHWIILSCNLNPKKKNFGVYFYDSVANDAPKEVVIFMKKIVDQVAASTIKNKEKFESKVNDKQRQFSNYDCGMYTIVFQTQFLKDIKFDEIKEGMQRDKYINSLRNILYRPNIK